MDSDHLQDENKWRARSGESDKAEIWAAIHEHDDRLKSIHRDFMDINRSVSSLSVEFAIVSKTIDAMEQKLGAKLSEQFLRLEAREFAMQQKVMTYSIGVMIAALGGLTYFVMNHLDFAR